MPPIDPDRPYTQRDVLSMLQDRLPGGKYNWIRDPEGNPAIQAYGDRFLPAQPIYVNHRPSVVKMQIKFTPRRISLTREAELWEAAEASRGVLKAAGITCRRQAGNTQETERDEQWVVTLPERTSEAGYEALAVFAEMAAECMGVASDSE